MQAVIFERAGRPEEVLAVRKAIRAVRESRRPGKVLLTG